MPDRLWDVTHLELDVRIDPRKGTVDGRSVHTLAPLGRPRDRVRLHQVALDVSEVRVDGELAENVRFGPDWMEIPVPPSRAGHRVEIRWTATPALGLHARGPWRGDAITEVWTQGEDEDHRYWFPSWDHPSDTFALTTHVTVPEGLVARANGELTGREPAGDGWTRWSFALEQPIVNYLVAIAAGEYRSVAIDGPVPLEILGPRTASEAELRVGAADAAEMLPFYAELLGEPYPYPSYRQVWVQGFLYGGMENASLTTLNGERRVDPAHPDRAPALASLIAHELAHQWFGDLLTCYGWRELWLNEGFATAYADRWLEHRYGPEHAAADLWDTRAHAVHVTSPMASRAHTFAGQDHSGVYDKGALVLGALRVHHGDAVYDAAIRRYVRENRFRLVESDDLRRAFDEETGVHHGWLFDQWVHGPGMPTWSTRWTWADGQLEVTVDRQGDEVFHAPVRVEVGGREGAITRTIWLDERSTRLVVDREEPPSWVAVDPAGGVPGTFQQDQPRAAWLAQLRRSPSPLARLDALHALAAMGADTDTIAAMAEVLVGPADGHYRAHAARALGELASDEAARAALLRGSADANAEVREASVDALHRAAPDDALIGRLRAILTGDPDPSVRATALSAWGEHDPAAGLAEARRALDRPDPSGELHRAALGLVEAHGTLADGVAALRFVAVNRRGVRAAAMHAALGRSRDEELPEAGRRRLAADLSRAARPLLDDADYRVRQRAIDVLGGLGRVEDLPALEAFVARNPVPELDEAARQAMAAIRQPTPDADPSEGLAERIRALEEVDREVEERLDRVESWR